MVGVDDSEDAIKAFKYAIQLAKDNDSKLVLVSILENNDMNIYQSMDKDYIHGKREDLEEHLLSYRQEAMEAGIKRVTAVVDEGDPGEIIVKKLIPDFEPDILVVGSKAKKGITKRFGSQAAYMAKYSPISVMVIR